MVDITIGAAGVIQPAEVKDVELYHPKSWVTKYVFCQDAKVIAIQYSITALSIGLVALVLSWLIRLQLAFPSMLSAIGPGDYLQFITMHGMIMVIYLLTALFLGGFGNYLIPLMVGARDMVFPYVNMISYWVYLLAVLVLVASYFMPGGPTGSGWTLYPPQAILSGTPGREWGIILMLASLILFIIGFTMGGLNYVVTVLQARTRGMTLVRMPLTGWGIFTATVIAFLVLRPSRGLHRRRAGLRHRLRPDQHPCEKKHLRLSHDGVGDNRHRRPQLRRMGAPHVCERHEPVFWVLLRHHHADYRHPNGHQGLQLGAHFVARRHSPHSPDAV